MNIEILKFIQFATDNNEIKIAEAMFDEKVVVRKGEDIKARLYKVFATDRPKFVRIMRRAGFNKTTKNYTTSLSVLNKMAERVVPYRTGGQAVANKTENASLETGREWYDSVLDTLVGGGTTVGSSTTVTEAPAKGSQTTMIMVAIVAIGGIGALIYFLNK